MVSRSNGVQSMNLPDFKTENLTYLLFESDDQGFLTCGWVGDYQAYLSALQTFKNYSTEKIRM